MKKRYLNIVVFALFVSMLWGCSDWTKPEAEDFFEISLFHFLFSLLA